VIDRSPPYPRELIEAAGDLAFRDDLTGLLNRRLLNSLLDAWWEEVAAGCRDMSFIMIDLDGFKEVNDRCGHLAGDAVLGATADLLRRHFRNDDLLIRYGGDEFLIVLPGVGRSDAGGLAERARQAMDALGEDEAVRQAGVSEPVSFSLGVASWPEDGSSGETVLSVADRRLFGDKRRRQRKATAITRWSLAVGVGVGVVAAGVILGLWAGHGLAPGPAPPSTPAAQPDDAADREAAAFGRREAELLAQIAGLKGQLEELARQPVSRDGREQQEAQSLALEEIIRRLETELRERTSMALLLPTPAPTAAPSMTPAPVPDDPPSARETADRVESPAPVTAPVVVLPVLHRASPPRYPEMAQRLRRETEVEVIVLVDESGRVVGVELPGPAAGLGFDEAAREAALRSEFLPGTRDGVPVAMETRITVQFRLARR